MPPGDRVVPARRRGGELVDASVRRQPAGSGRQRAGVDEAALLRSCEEHIFIGDEHVHKRKPIWAYPHRKWSPPWLYSRAKIGGPDIVAIRKRPASPLLHVSHGPPKLPFRPFPSIGQRPKIKLRRATSNAWLAGTPAQLDLKSVRLPSRFANPSERLRPPLRRQPFQLGVRQLAHVHGCILPSQQVERPNTTAWYDVDRNPCRSREFGVTGSMAILCALGRLQTPSRCARRSLASFPWRRRAHPPKKSGKTRTGVPLKVSVFAGRNAATAAPKPNRQCPGSLARSPCRLPRKSHHDRR